MLGQQTTVSIAEPFSLTAEQTDLEGQIRNLALSKPLRVGVFAIEPKTGRYINIESKGQFAAASIIKLPILVSLMQAIDRHDLSLDKMLVIRPDLMTGGSGHLQWQPVGTKISLKDTARLMIIFSDNTATNMVIDALGGMKKLNQDFDTWGLKQTKLNNWLADFDGTNKTSPYDLVYLLSRVDRGELVSKESRQYMMELLGKARVRTLLWPGLGPGSKLAHKSGDIGGMIGDAGIITTSDGSKYYAAMQVERPHNDMRANKLVREASKLVYGRFTDIDNIASVKTPDSISAKN